MPEDRGAVPVGPSWREPRAVAGALVALAVALAFFTRFGLTGSLSRDEAIYAYAGQQLAHGVPPYVSIFDPKGPVAATLAALAVLVGHPLGLTDLTAIRLAYLAASLACVLLVLALGTRLWESLAAGVGAAVVLAGFHGFAADAIAGPDAKTPALALLMAGLLAAGRRRWSWAGALASVATLTWQPLVLVVVCLVVTALVTTEGRTGRARWVAPGLVVAGAAVPGLVTLVAFAAARATRALYESTLLYPLTGTPHDETLGERVHAIAHVVHDSYGLQGAVLVPAGLVLLPVAAWLTVRARVPAARDVLRDPLAVSVVLAMLSQVAYALYDFQGYPDVFPLLPFAALGVAGAAAVAVRAVPARAARAAAAVAAVALVVLAGSTWSSLTTVAAADTGLAPQRASTCAAVAIAGPGPLYSLGTPVPYVLSHRRSPDRFIYLGGQVDLWHARHEPGGLRGWIDGVAAAHPPVIVVEGWPTTTLRAAALARLGRYGYRPRHLGDLDVLLDPAGLRRAHQVGLRPTSKETARVLGTEPGSTWTCSKDVRQR